MLYINIAIFIYNITYYFLISLFPYFLIRKHGDIAVILHAIDFKTH
jgi:hypothetical protein